MAAMAGIVRLGTSTLSDTSITSTDTSNMDWDDYFVISKTDDMPKIEMPVEYKEFPKFKVAKKLNNTMKISSFVKKRQQNFSIRNAL